MNTRQKWLVVFLLATVAAAFWPQQHEQGIEVVEVVRQPRAISGKDETLAGGSSGKPAGESVIERMSTMHADLFPRESWAPPPPPPKPYKPPPPPPPKPPPLPFSYLGSWQENGVKTVFVRQGDQPLPIKTGQILFGTWRVDEITSGQVVFTYLPLNMQTNMGTTP